MHTLQDEKLKILRATITVIGLRLNVADFITNQHV
jgi:hypothetical protein